MDYKTDLRNVLSTIDELERLAFKIAELALLIILLYGHIVQQFLRLGV